MDRAEIEQLLVDTEWRVALGLQKIMAQHERLEELRRIGHDTADALRLLTDLEEVHAMHVAEARRLRKELAAVTDASDQQ